MTTGRTPKSISDNDLPELFTVADRISTKGQKRYLRLTIADLAVLLLGALSADIAIEGFEKVILAISAILLAAGTGFAYWLSRTAFKKSWYGGRGIAESVKSLSWRYMMRSAPFAASEDNDAQASVQLEAKIEELRADFAQLLGREVIVSAEPGPVMQKVRAADLDTRKQIYLNNRLLDQKAWYIRKATTFSRLERKWYFVIVGAQALAMVVAIVMIFFEGFNFNPTGILATVAAAALAWLQVKQYEELAQSYQLTAQGLDEIAALLEQVSDEQQLITLATAAEVTMSKEHGIWLIKRDQNPDLASK